MPTTTKKLRVLFITYDGLLDPLGQSQVLPYVMAVREICETLHIVSFEKKHNKFSCVSTTTSLSTAKIAWTPLNFTKRYGVIGKLYDAVKMFYCTLLILRKEDVNLVHARSHPPAQIAALLKWIYGVKFIFDFRGLWVDERVEKGGWNLAHALDRFQFRANKFLEKKILSFSDHVVVLTEAVVPEVRRLGSLEQSRFSTIPCCADFDHYKIPTASQISLTRRSLGIAENALVLGYLGSVGGMYRSDRFFKCIEYVSEFYTQSRVLALTPDTGVFNALAKKYLDKSLHANIVVMHADREKVAEYLPVMNILLSFVKEGYARSSMSPTKLAEALACGVPFISSPGVGDVEDILRKVDGGYIIDPDDDSALAWFCQNIPEIIKLGGSHLRLKAEPILGLGLARQKYRQVYRDLAQPELSVSKNNPDG